MDHLSQYKSIRKTGGNLNLEMLDLINKNAMFEAADLLGMLEKKQIMLESKEDRDYLFDFALNEVFCNQQKYVEIYKENNPNIDDIKKEVLDALLSSFTSLFKIVSVSPDSGTLELRDLLNRTNKPIILTDINFSQTASNHLLLFTRVLQFDHLSISSGASFIFHGNHELYILKKYEKMVKKINVENESAKRFIAFFQLSKEDGNRIVTKDII